MESSRQRFLKFRSNLAASGPAADGTASSDDGPRRGATDWGRRRRDLREYWTWVRPRLGSVVLVYGLALAAGLLSLILPAATMHIVDHVIPARDAHTLTVLGCVLLATILVQQGIELWRYMAMARLNARLTLWLRKRLYRHVLRLPLHELWAIRSGGITSRVSGDVDAVSGLVQIGVVTPAVALTKIVLTLIVLLWINWQMSLAALVLLPPIVLLNLTQIRRIRPIYRSMRQDRQHIDGRVVETFGGIRVVRAFGREQAEYRQYALDHHTVIRKHLRAALLEYLVWAGWGALVPLAALIIVWVGATMILAGRTTIGGLIAFQMYLMMLLVPVSLIVRSIGEMQQGLAAMERVFDLLHKPVDKPDAPGARPAPPRVEWIEFDRVSFAYRPDQPVLREVSLRVAGGQTVALVGPSGAGKTTLTNLVARFYDPDLGALRLNGVDLRQVRLRSYRKLLGLVQQDTFLFDGTVAENIAYARPRADRNAIQDAARRANAHGFIMGFADGYDTLVGERGVKLSGGQAQRISIARALLADPQILILDEATSNLDSESEQLIQASMRTLLADRTTFVIAHRLSTVLNAHLIVVLHEGRVVETGTHDELMAAGGAYRAMVERQRRGLEEGAVAADAWLA